MEKGLNLRKNNNTARALLIHRYFWPDSPPYAVILKEMASLLVEKGLQVDVLSSVPSYKSVDHSKKYKWIEHNEAAYKITRLPVFNEAKGGFFKFFNFIFFPLSVFLFLLTTKRRDIVTVSSAPPVLLAFLVALACRIKGSALIYHCMDMHPELGSISGEFRSKFIYKLLMKMEMFTCRYAKKIIVLSKDMTTAMVDRDESLQSKLEIINNFSLPDTSDAVEVPGEYRKDENVTRLVFAGNLGRFQALDKLVEVFIAHSHSDDLELVFLGEGAMLNRLVDMSKSVDNIRFIPHQPVAIAKAIIRESDYGIISLEGDVLRYAFPSKTMTYMECGVPIVLFTSSDTELADYLHTNKLGHAVLSSNEEQINTLLNTKLTSKADVLKRDEIIKFYEANYSQQIFNTKLLSLLGGVCAVN